ncbi:MAG: TIGR02646 family protein [Spirochaetia bacterium]|nr:TIGR02646 family protein [Spirochaetia bacterium]
MLCDLNSVHIEHLYPRALYPERQLEYENLLLSCNGLEAHGEVADGTACHCGHIKGSKDAREMISPLHPDCESSFHYTHDGRINPTADDTPHAASTITGLGLNTPSLVRRRKNIFEVVFDPEARMSNEELVIFTRSKITLKEDGTYDSFPTLWAQIERSLLP